MAAVCPLCLIL